MAAFDPQPTLLPPALAYIQPGADGSNFARCAPRDGPRLTTELPSRCPSPPSSARPARSAPRSRAGRPTSKPGQRYVVDRPAHNGTANPSDRGAGRAHWPGRHPTHPRREARVQTRNLLLWRSSHDLSGSAFEAIHDTMDYFPNSPASGGSERHLRVSSGPRYPRCGSDRSTMSSAQTTADKNPPYPKRRARPCRASIRSSMVDNRKTPPPTRAIEAPDPSPASANAIPAGKPRVTATRAAMMLIAITAMPATTKRPPQNFMNPLTLSAPFSATAIAMYML